MTSHALITQHMSTPDANAFDWIPFYTELADRLVPFRSRSGDLVQFLEELRSNGLTVTTLDDKDEAGGLSLLPEIDPFTFFGTFNRGIVPETRIAILAAVKERFDVAAAVPTQFEGIPILNNQKSWFFAYKPQRKPDDIDRLWEVFVRALGPDPLSDDALSEAFDQALDVKYTNLNLTMGLFWIRPYTFLNLDGTNRKYLAVKLPKGGLSSAFYLQTIESIRSSRSLDFPHISAEAWRAGQGTLPVPPIINNDVSYWMVGAYWEGEDTPDQTARFLAEGIWENGYRDRYLDLVKEMKVGDRLAIKSFGTQKKGLPFDSLGHTMSFIRIKVIGTVVANRGDGRSVEVEWECPLDPPRNWYFYTTFATVWRLRKDNEMAQALVRFAFDGESQDYRYFAQKWWGTPKSATQPFAVPEEAIEVTGSAPPYAVEDLVSDGVFLSENLLERVLQRLRTKRNLILQGAPGVGKTFLAKRLAYALMEAKDESRILIVQFHPSYSYEDFVRGYRPSANAGKFTLVDGPFLRICRAADSDPDRKYVLNIDEINRGNLSQIFGELMMLLEADKRGAGHAINPLYQSRPDERLHVPTNLYVIGTMNIADRSLALVDYALRRRFAYFLLEPQFDSAAYRAWLRNRGMSDDLIQRITSRMEALNATISEDSQLGDAYRIGHSFFCPTGTDFSTLHESWYTEIVNTEIAPLLEEYWYDAREKAKAAIEGLLS